MKVRDDGESISAETYRALRASILSGRIAPGIKVTTPDLCKTFDASPGAVREALSRLRAEGLINAEAHRGYSVTPISVSDLRDLTQIRIDIETSCLARSIEKGGSQWEAHLIACTHLLVKAYEKPRTANSDRTELMAAHQAFHLALVSACDSPRLLRMRQQLFDESERYRRMDVVIAPHRDATKEHRQIADAALERNVARARKLLGEHIGRTTAAIIKEMTEQHSAARPARSQIAAVRRAR